MSVNNPDIKRMTIYSNKGIICKNMPLYRNKSDKISIGIKKWKNFKKNWKNVLTNKRFMDIMNLQKQIHIDNLNERKVQSTKNMRSVIWYINIS